MLRHIFNTISFRLATQLIGMFILFMTANILGIEGKGEKSIFMANLTLVILLNGFIGSSVIVYLTPKVNFYKLLVPSYVWAVFSSFLSPLLLSVLFNSIASFYDSSPDTLDLESTSYYFYLVTASFMGSVFEFHSMVLLGKQKITQMNLLSFIKTCAIGITLLLFFHVFQMKTVESYFIAVNLAYVLGTSISIIMILKLPERFTVKNLSSVLKRLVRLGFIDQFSNVIQFLNRRLPYYPLLLLYGEGDVGILSVGVALSEAILFLPQSISTVQYAKISNSTDKDYNISISVKMFRLSLVILTAGLLFLLLFPFYDLLLTDNFEMVKDVIALLSIGIINLGASSILNHYFSGIGKFEQNVYSNLLGLLATIFIGCAYLIPTYGIWGAALTPTISYTVINIYLAISFVIKTKTPFLDFIPKGSDFSYFLQVVSTQFKKFKS